MIRGQVELAGAARNPGALLDRHQPIVLAKVLADFAGHGEERRARALDVREDLLENALRDLRIVAKSQEDLLLPLELLQEVRLQIGAARYFENLEQRQERRMMRARVFVLGEKMVGALEQVFEAQQRADSLVERILVSDHLMSAARG